MMHKVRKLSIRVKVILVFIITTLIILLINLFMYVNVNRMLNRLEEIYMSNISLNELSDTLVDVQASMTAYLNTRTSDALEDYYRNEQDYSQLIFRLNGGIYGNDLKLMEKNIKNMSEEYLELTGQTVDAKRGGNVEKVKARYEKATELQGYLKTYIYSLNNRRFKTNTNSYEALALALNRSELVGTVILAAVGVLITALIYAITKSITGPLSHLARRANEVAEGNLEVDLVPVRNMDEVGIVATAFNQMVASIRIHMERITENMEKEAAMKEKELMMEGHLKDAQLKYLQAQINPHFLFNTLNAGAQLAMMEGADKTCLFVENMADFFRYNVKKISQDAAIREELELVDSYLYILNVRFGGEIHFRKQVDETLLDLRVPSMILQPIVENAANYGIRGIDWEGWIELLVYREPERICISIQDNGVGMSREKIREIMEGEVREADLSRNSTGIGLGNVISRLRLYYNREEVFEIRSDGEGKGTQVLLYLPAEEECYV